MSTPKAPNPAKTAAAQSAANRDTAMSEALLNQYDQQGPEGSISYAQNGWNEYTDSLTGKTVRVPKFTQTTSLSPEQQELYNLNTATQKNIGQIGLDQSGKIGSLLGTNVDLSAGNVAKYADTRYRSGLDEEWNARAGSFEADLLNRGVRPGSAAYTRAMSDFNKNRSNAYDSRLIAANDQALNAILTERNQPINEVSSLMNGSQVSQPQFQSTGPQVGVAGVDYTGLVNQEYQAKVAKQQALLGGMFGLGKAALGGWAGGGFNFGGGAA